MDPLPWFQFARKESDPEAEIREIWAMGVEGDNARKVVNMPRGQFLFGVHWSPLGNRLAYIRIEKQRSGRFLFSIESCGLNGDSRAALIPPSDLFIDDFCWLSDGRIVYSTQSSANTRLYNLFETRVESGTGKPGTNPVRLAGPTGALELVSLSATADSKRLVLTKGEGRSRVYLAEVSGGAARLSAPRLLTADDSNDWPNAWTADSRAVLFYSHRNGKFQIFKQDIGKETAEPLVIGHDDAYGPRVSSDGAWVLYRSAPTSWPPGAAKMMRVPIHGGSPQFVMDIFNAKNWNCAGRANFCALLETSKDGTQFTITSFDPIRGRGKLLRTVQKQIGEYASALSPEGSMFALVRSGEPVSHIRVLSLAGGADREITVRNPPNMTSLDFTADTNGFYAAFSSPQGSGLFYVDLNGNSRSLWQQKGAYGDEIGGWAIPSPDGRYVAINGRAIDSNAWMIENF